MRTGVRILTAALAVIVAGAQGTRARDDSDAPPWAPITQEQWDEDGHGFRDPAAVVVLEEITADDRDLDDEKCLLSTTQRIKVLRSDAAVADFELPFHEDYASIERIRARTVHPDGRVFEVPDEAILGGILLSTKEGTIEKRTFSMPGVEPGVIIDVHVDFKNRDPNYAWEVQREIPVRLGRYTWIPYRPSTENVLETWFAMEFVTPNFAWVDREDAQQTDLEKYDEEDGGMIRFSIRDVPALQLNPLILAGAEPRTMLMLYYGSLRSEESYWAFLSRMTQTWLGEYEENFKNLEPWADEVLKLSGHRNRIDTAFELLTSRVEPDDLVQLRRGRQGKIDVNRAIKEGRGSRIEMSIYLWRLLRRCGVEAGLAFVRDRRTGPVVPVAKLWQFNSVIVIARDDDRNFVYCAPGEAGAVPGWLPWYLEGVDAFFPDDTQKGFRRLRASRPDENTAALDLDCWITRDGGVKGEISWSRSGNAAWEARSVLRQLDSDARGRFAEEELRQEFPLGEFEEIRVTGFEDGTEPLVFQARVRSEGVVGRIGSHRSVRPFAILGEEEDPFREFPVGQAVIIPYAYEETEEVRIHLPEEAKMELLPSTEMRVGFAGTAETNFSQKRDVVTARRTFRIDYPEFEPKHAALLEQLFDQKLRSQDLAVVYGE